MRIVLQLQELYSDSELYAAVHFVLPVDKHVRDAVINFEPRHLTKSDCDTDTESEPYVVGQLLHEWFVPVLF